MRMSFALNIDEQVSINEQMFEEERNYFQISK